MSKHGLARPDGRQVTPPPVETQRPTPDPAIEVGQIWEGVVIPDRAINRLGLRPGHVLQPIQIEQKQGDVWVASFVGDRMCQIMVDAEMLATGTRR